MLHDIGKLIVPNDVLQKPGELDDEKPFPLLALQGAFADLQRG